MLNSMHCHVGETAEKQSRKSEEQRLRKKFLDQARAKIHGDIDEALQQ